MAEVDAKSVLDDESEDGLTSALDRFLPARLSPADLAEIQQARQSMVAATSETDAAALFPDACSRPCYRVYEHTCGQDHRWPAGVYYHFLGKSSAKEPPALRDVRICGVLKAVAIARNRQGGEFGLLLDFRDRLGQPKQWNMPCRLLAGRGDELQKALFDQGLDIHYAQRSRLADYLCQQHTDRTVWLTSTPGWFDHVYVLPDRTIGGDSTDAVLLQSEGNINSNLYRQAGTLAGNNRWRVYAPEILFCCSLSRWPFVVLYWLNAIWTVWPSIFMVPPVKAKPAACKSLPVSGANRNVSSAPGRQP
jgi:putative DNA primase/helicase